MEREKEKTQTVLNHVRSAHCLLTIQLFGHQSPWSFPNVFVLLLASLLFPQPFCLLSFSFTTPVIHSLILFLNNPGPADCVFSCSLSRLLYTKSVSTDRDCCWSNLILLSEPNPGDWTLFNWTIFRQTYCLLKVVLLSFVNWTSYRQTELDSAKQTCQSNLILLKLYQINLSYIEPDFVGFGEPNMLPTDRPNTTTHEPLVITDHCYRLKDGRLQSTKPAAVDWTYYCPQSLLLLNNLWFCNYWAIL